MIIFGLAGLVLYECHRLRVPVLVGCLLTGLPAGPHGLGVVLEIEAVRALAEIEVVSLLFTIGLEFSFWNLLQVRRSVLIEGASAAGYPLAETRMRKKYGVTLLAIRSGSTTLSIPWAAKFSPISVPSAAQGLGGQL